MAEKKMNFEQAMDRLDEIDREEALSLFEEGTKLVKKCSAQLERAEQKVSKLLAGPDDTVQEKPFSGEAQE